MGSAIHKKTINNIQKILNLLKSGDQYHIRGISKNTGIHPFTVDYIVENYLGIFLEIRSTELYGFKAKLVKLKPGRENITIEDVLAYIKVKNKIKKVGFTKGNVKI